jgi:hypothetical protein
LLALGAEGREFESLCPTKFSQKTTLYDAMSKEQIAAFTAVYDHNNRSIQLLNERALYVDSSPAMIIP